MDNLRKLLEGMVAFAICCQVVSAGQPSMARTTTPRRLTWSNYAGKKIDGEWTVANYGTAHAVVTRKRGHVFIDGTALEKLNDANRKKLRLITGYSPSEFAAKTARIGRKPSHIRFDVVVLRNIATGKLLSMPVAMLANRDRETAREIGRQIEVARAEKLKTQMLLAAQLRKLGKLPPKTSKSGPANVEQHGEFEGQFGQQGGPDEKSGSESGGEH